ncbi:MAG: GGDEF domain-containing protein [Clostridiales bacterium]|nr:GGDEF domain-containing protein [Clostridiales bacterium]
MKQFQIAYKNDTSFRKALDVIKRWCESNRAYTVLFRLYSEDMELDHIKHVCDIINEKMPDALYLGCSTHANIFNGALSKAKITMSCTIFEYASTQVKLMQFPFTEENAKEVVDKLKEYCDVNPWVSAVEMHATMLGMSVREFCDEMSILKDDIQIFGGGAYNPKMDNTTTYVFSKGNGISEHGIVFLLFGGSDFHIYSTYIAGWKPLTRNFTVTKADGATLSELDGQPAFDIYQRYLNIKNSSDSIISNTLEFPLFMDYKGVEVLRCPLGLNEDGSLMMATETPEGSHVRIAYGDPETILANIRHDGQKIAAFQPEVIQTFSCAARRAFWGDENISDETILFNSIAPTSGFYTSGEFLFTNGAMRNFNITLVLAAMREGESKNDEIVDLYDAKLDNIESEARTPLIRRFVSFIEATTKELDEINKKLEETNKKLAILSITDGLTNLYNRTETERRIRYALDKRTKKGVSLIMLDVDDFKKVNDIYGHAEGDRVLIGLSDVLSKVMADVPSAVGRWGGEEFMVLLPSSDITKAAKLAEKIRKEFASVSYEMAGCQTVSLGVCQAKDGETADALCSRVDDALYKAKANGKNQVVKQD